MSLFFGRSQTVEKRALISLPWVVGEESVSGVRGALGLTPVLAAVRHIVDFGSTLPLDAYRKIGDERQPTALPQLFRSLEQRGELVPWLGTALMSVATQGNAVGLIAATDGMGFPTNVAWVPMDKVSVDDSAGRPQWFIDGRRVDRMDLVHIPWITVPGRTLALSPIEMYAATIKAGLGAQKFGNDWFAGGGFPPAVFQNTQRTITAEQATTIRARLTAAIRRREPLVTGNDWTFIPVTIPPEQAQFIETQKLTANQVASIYGIDPTEIGGEAPNSLTYSTEELRQINRASNMRPYLVRFERAFASWLPERQFVKFHTDATIRTDIKTRHEVYEIQRRIGLLSLNEQRELEDRPPVTGGDVHVPPVPPAPTAVRSVPAPPAPPVVNNYLTQPAHVVNVTPPPAPDVRVFNEVQPAAAPPAPSLHFDVLPAPVGATDVHVHNAIAAAPAPDVRVTNDIHVPVSPTPQVHLSVPDAPAPVVNVTNEVAAPVVNVEPTPVEVKAEAPVVNVTNEVTAPPAEVRVDVAAPVVEIPAPVVNIDVVNEVQPSQVVILPSEPKTRRIERDASGQIIATHEE